MELIEKVSDLLNDANDNLANFPTTMDVNQNDVTGERAKEYGIALGTQQVLMKVVKIIEDDVEPYNFHEPPGSVKVTNLAKKLELKKGKKKHV